MSDHIFLLNKVSFIYNNQKKKGNEFNLFSIINLTTDEVRIHSKIIAEFLNPKGSHGQGDLFLNCFIELINKKINGSFFMFSQLENKLNVHVEYSIPKQDDISGRLDILIEAPFDKKAILIENKIYARDQELQLLRYVMFGKRRYGADFILLYLTLGGKESKEAELCGLKEGIDYVSISYSEDIIIWLEKSKEKILSEGKFHITVVIDHYINLIKKLTNSEKMIPDIVDELLKDQDKFQAALTISKQIEYAKKKLQKKFWQRLYEIFSKNNVYKIYPTSFSLFDSELDSDAKNPGIDIFYQNEINKIPIEYTFRIELGNHRPFYGFLNTEENPQYGNLSWNQIADYFKTHFEFKSAQLWFGWKYIEPELRLYDFTETTCEILFNEQILDKTVEGIATQSFEYIQSLEEYLKNK